MIWLGIFIGIIIMQLASFILLIITKENEYVLLPFSIFAFLPFVMIIRSIIGMIKNRKKRKLKQLNHKQENKGEKIEITQQYKKSKM